MQCPEREADERSTTDKVALLVLRTCEEIVIVDQRFPSSTARVRQCHSSHDFITNKFRHSCHYGHYYF